MQALSLLYEMDVCDFIHGEGKEAKRCAFL